MPPACRLNRQNAQCPITRESYPNNYEQKELGEVFSWLVIKCLQLGLVNQCGQNVQTLFDFIAKIIIETRLNLATIYSAKPYIFLTIAA